MANLCTIQIIGNLGRDPETRFVASGRQVTSFSVAVNRILGAGPDGERKQETEWFRVSCWGKLAETAEQFLQKGRRVYVSGRFSSRSYTGRDGQNAYSLEIQADQLVLLDGAPRADLGEMGPGESAGYSERPMAAAAPAARRPSAPPPGDDFGEDDIPF